MLNQNPVRNHAVCADAHFGTVRSKVTAVLLAVFLCVSLCALPACSASGETAATDTTNESSVSSITVTMQVNLDAVDTAQTVSKQVAVPEGATVLDVLNASEIAFSAEDSSYGMYVTAIDGVAQGEHGAQSGWMYTINGEYPTESIDVVVVSADDQLVFTYVTEYVAE